MAKPRKNYAKKRTIYADTDDGRLANGAEFTFSNGKSIRVDSGDFPAPILREAMWHGFRQKIGDSWNKAESVDEAFRIGFDIVERLKAGDWNAERAGGFGISDDWILKAVADLKGKQLPEIEVTWKGLPDLARDSVRKSPAIKARAEKLRAEAKEAASTPAEGDTDVLAAF